MSNTIQFVEVGEIKTLFNQLKEELSRDHSYPEVMTMEQLCEYLNLSRPTIQKAIREKHLPVVTTFGSQLPRFVKKEIDLWLARQI